MGTSQEKFSLLCPKSYILLKCNSSFFTDDSCDSPNLPAGFTSEKNVPTFFPSTISVMTWPEILGCVPLAITTEVPPWRAHRAALTCKKCFFFFLDMHSNNYFNLLAYAKDASSIWLFFCEIQKPETYLYLFLYKHIHLHIWAACGFSLFHGQKNRMQK